LRFLIFFCLTCLAAGCSTVDPRPTPTAQGGASSKLSLNKSWYFPGETILVTFVAGADSHESAWIGAFPIVSESGQKSLGEEPDLITYQSLQKRTQGILKFQAPDTPGALVLRMYDNSSKGEQVASVSFNVDATQYPVLGIAEKEFSPGAEIEVSFWMPDEYRESAWVVLVPTDVETGEEEENALTRQKIEGKTLGTLVFAAPENPGKYDLRLKWSLKVNGGQMSGTAPVSFVVK
jgi:hypothetical protein